MDFKNFLEKLYFGHLEMETFRNYPNHDFKEQIQEIIAQYDEISGKFPLSKAENSGLVSKELLDELKLIGFFGLDIPEVYGGLGLSLSQYLTVVENVATRSMDLGITALAHLSIGTKGILLFGSETQKQKYLIPAASGAMIFSYALTEPRKGSDAKNIETTAILDDSGEFYILNGQKAYITNANYAGGLTVFAQMDPKNPGFLGAFIVETAWDGVKIGQEIPKMGLKASSTAAISFSNVRVPKENLLSKPGDGFKIAMTILNYGRLALGAASAGIMKRSFEDMLDRAKSRVQFGVPIYRFQLIQEKLIEAKVNSYVAAAMTYLTAAMLTHDPLAPVAIESSHCKLFGTTRAWNVVNEALQVAGGSGYLSTQPYEKRVRDFRVTTIFEGTTEIHSIYPALYVLKDFSKKFNHRTATRIERYAFILKTLFGPIRLGLQFKSAPMQQAARLIKKLTRRIRIMIIAGILLYREEILSKQFFLRRITHLSLNLYGLVAVLARIEAARASGRDIEEDLQLLSIFTEKARRVNKLSFHLMPSREEKLNENFIDRIFRDAQVNPEGI
jgi:acyl-CoA dehydrogenase family protein 9